MTQTPRSRLRALAEYGWAAVALLAMAAVVLGLVGWSRYEGGAGWGSADIGVRTAQLFVLESNAPNPPVPWQLQIARVLAPLVAVSAAAGALVTVFRDRLRLLWLRWGRTDHVVVAGLGWKGFELARAFRAEGYFVAAIELDESARAIRGARERGIAVLRGDATDPALLERAAVGRARYLFTTCGRDEVNVDVAFAAGELTRDRRRGTLRAFAHLHDLALWRLLSAERLAAPRELPFTVEFFNVDDAAARRMIESWPPVDGKRTGVAVVGDADLADAVVLHAAREWQNRSGDPGHELPVLLAAPGARERLATLLDRHPELERIAAFDAVPCGMADSASPVAAADPAAVYVVGGRQTERLSAALSISSRTGAPVVLALDDADAGVAAAVRRRGGTVAVFGVLTRTLAPEIVSQGLVEVLARAKHDQYVRDALRRGESPRDNPSLVPWESLGETLRESNRRFAEGVGATLQRSGCSLVPAPLIDPASVDPVLGDDEVEELAILEHDRWCADLERDGWRHTTGPKDPERKLHPSLVPWAELSDVDRDRDREPIRALPEILARAGFEVVRPGGVRSARAGGVDAGPLDPPDGAADSHPVTEP